MDPFEAGELVRSVAVGRKPEFDGIVISRMGYGYHVRDIDDDTLWHRDHDELSLREARPEEMEALAA